MATITVPPFALPEDLAEKAKAKGLLSPDALIGLLREALKEEVAVRDGVEGQETFPPGFDQRFKGATSPKLVGSVTFLGDIIEPIDVQWEVDS